MVTCIRLRICLGQRLGSTKKVSSLHFLGEAALQVGAQNIFSPHLIRMHICKPILSAFGGSFALGSYIGIHYDARFLHGKMRG